MKSIFSTIISFFRLCKRVLKRLLCYDIVSIRWQTINDFARTMEDGYIYRIDIATLAYYIKHIKSQCNTPLYLLSDVNIMRGGGQIQSLCAIQNGKILKNNKRSEDD